MAEVKVQFPEQCTKKEERLKEGVAEKITYSGETGFCKMSEVMRKKVLWSDKPKSRIVWPKFKILFVLENWHNSLSIKHSSPTVKQ